MMRELKILLAVLLALLFLTSCQDTTYPAAGYNQLFGGDVLYEWKNDVYSIYTPKGIRL